MNNKVATIAPKKLHDILDSGKNITLIDVRNMAEYGSGHIAGAKHIPLDELSADTLAEHEIHADASNEQPIYLTCHAGLRAQQAADLLIDAGYRNLTLLEGGMLGWQNEGLPTNRCGNVISLERQVQITIGVLLVLKVIFGFTVHELFLGCHSFYRSRADLCRHYQLVRNGTSNRFIALESKT